ncbi:protein FAM151A isoform X1 [Tachysurus fulvidraco]|uniref:protein FAM151A isoform X1 n=1 Tax=Tachysurus fulvidraco TaxID=1234273 RepID=UPI000F4D893D|nr:protein FAM151A isoform X1 [Tachysurus fulvidraco]
MDMREKKSNNSQEDEEKDEEKEPKAILGVFTKQQFTRICVAVGLVVLLLIITVTSLVLPITSGSETSETMVPFATDGDMLEFLLQNGEIQEKDGLYATWYHSANSKAETQKALESDTMILEADVNVQGHNTDNETNIPIMAHPPDVYSDNTLEEWLDAVIRSKKGIKLDFKSLQAVEPSLNLLKKKNQTGINRPVWLNADILPGPNVPGFWPVVNGTRFFELIQTKFPYVTISPGWKVLYLPLLPDVTYTRAMVMEMYTTVKHLPQRITFPVLAVMVRNGWPHLSWLLSQCSRFSLTLWQGQANPTVNDLLFVRDNTNPQRIYYDIYEPVLSQFKEAAKQKDRPRRFYTGGDIVDYFKPANSDGLNILWEKVYDQASLLSELKESPGGMLVIPVTSGTSDVRIPVVEGSMPELPLQNCLDLVLASKNPWGIYLRVKSQTQLATSLHLLRKAYANDLLYHPVWINMDISLGVFNVKGYITGLEFVRTINQIFPYVTMAPSWPQEVLDQGYTPQMVEDMMELFQEVWQDVSLQLLAVHLDRSEAGIRIIQQSQERFSLTVEHTTRIGGLRMKSFTFVRNGTRRRTFYNVPKAVKGFVSEIPNKT